MPFLLEDSRKSILSEHLLKEEMSNIMEVNDVESDIADLTDRIENLDDILTDDRDRMDYVRQLTAEFLELFLTLTNELDSNEGVEIPETLELMNKVMGRKHRKRYYMSKFRL